MPCGGLLVFYRWELCTPLEDCCTEVAAAVRASVTKPLAAAIWRGESNVRAWQRPDGSMLYDEETKCLLLHLSHVLAHVIRSLRAVFANGVFPCRLDDDGEAQSMVAWLPGRCEVSTADSAGTVYLSHLCDRGHFDVLQALQQCVQAYGDLSLNGIAQHRQRLDREACERAMNNLQAHHLS